MYKVLHVPSGTVKTIMRRLESRNIFCREGFGFPRIVLFKEETLCYYLSPIINFLLKSLEIHLPQVL